MSMQESWPKIPRLSLWAEREKVSFLTFISRTYKKLNNTLQYLPNKLSLCIRLDHKANYVEFIQVSLSCVRVAHCQTTSLFYMCVSRFMVILSSSTFYKYIIFELQFVPSGREDNSQNTICNFFGCDAISRISCSNIYILQKYCKSS